MGNSMKKTKKLLIAGPCVIEDGINTMDLAFNLDRLAKKYNLPIVIHSRKSYDEIFEVLESNKGYFLESNNW